MTLTIRLALRNLARNRRRSILAGSFIAFSLVALIFTDAFMRGMTESMLRSATHTFSGEAQIHAAGYLDEPEVEGVIPDLDRLRRQLEANAQVQAFAPRVQSSATLSSSANMLGIQLIGIEPQAELGVSRIHQAIVQGRALGLDSSQITDILIGSRLAELLEVELGDRVVLSASMADSGELNQQLFRVSGIFRFNNRGMDDALAFVPLEVGQQLLGVGQGVHQVALRMRSPELALDTELPLWARLSGDSLDARPWPALMPDLGAIVQYTDFGLYVIGAILFVLAGLGVVNTLFMSIYERTYEFGVLRSIGTRAGAVGRLIVTEAFLLGLLSVLAGIVLGLALTYGFSVTGIQYGSGVEFSGISLHEPIYPQLTLGQFTLLPLWVVALTVVASLYPAFYAARIQPASALHKSL